MALTMVDKRAESAEHTAWPPEIAGMSNLTLCPADELKRRRPEQGGQNAAAPE